MDPAPVSNVDNDAPPPPAEVEVPPPAASCDAPAASCDAPVPPPAE